MFQGVWKMLFAAIFILLLSLAPWSEAASSAITFPTSFTSPEVLDPLQVKNYYQKGIDAVQSVAGLVQNLLMQETINFAAKNWVISPLSLAGVFAQLLMGSRGEIREILSQALSLADDGRDLSKLEVHRQLGNLLRFLQHPGKDDYTLLTNAVVFLQAGFPLKATYKHALFDFYDTKIIPVDFTGNSIESLKKINDWVKNSTLGRFGDVLPSPLPPSTVSLMANVVYFKGSWEIPFDPEYTKRGMFFIDQNRKVEVDYMYGEQEVLYGNTSDYQLIGLPFKSRKVVIYILLPNGKFSTRVAMKQLDAMASSAKLEKVSLVLPKFQITTTISVKNSIAKYLRKKMTPVQRYLEPSFWKNFTRYNDVRYRKLPFEFNKHKENHFDMGGASEDIRFKIDDIFHKVSVQVDEVGTELVAITSTLVDHAGNDFILRVDRPFLFFVRHEVTMTHLFWGLVVNPGKSKI